MTVIANNLIQDETHIQSIPDGVSIPYEKVQWLQSSGSQFIRTEVFASEDIVCTFCNFTALSFSSWGVFCGVCDQDIGSNTTPWMFRWPNVNSKIGILTGCSNGADANNYLNFSVPYQANEQISRITFSRNFIQSESPVSRGSAPTAFSSSRYPLFLFGCNQAGSLWRGTSMRLQACKIEENGEVLHDFVAVKHDGVGYMYDKVSKRLFGNAGAGNFILGPDVA